MRSKISLILLSVLAVTIQNSHGCQMENVNNWNIPIIVSIEDVFRGQFFSRNTNSITGINNYVFIQDLNRGPYLSVSFANSQFSISTNDAFPDYEEYETLDRISLTVTFNCDTGNTNSLVILVDIIDTNNNDPLFRPDNVYEFSLPTPLPPGYRITGCLHDIFNRDIDLTTQRVDYFVYDSPAFEIVYDAETSTTPKEFNALLRTTTFIRSIPEPIEFMISATDVDLTGDLPRTTYATVRITSDDQFVLPDELVFSQTYYMATYTQNHQVVLQETISLAQGYHVDVQLRLRDSEYSQYFSLVGTGNQRSIAVASHLPVEILRQNKVLLVVEAERDLTVGASATIVITLPEGRILSFENTWYLGQIFEDSSSTLPNMVLNGGDDLEVELSVKGDYASYFLPTRQSNVVYLTMSSAFPPEVFENYAFTVLEIEASYPEAVTGVATVVIELVKEPIIHPVFDEAFYIGQYSNERGLLFEQTIRLTQGYDNTVLFDLEGDDSQGFTLVRNADNSYTLALTENAVPNVNDRHQLVFSVIATKPNGIPARATIVISVTGVIISFAQTSYTGQIVDNSLNLPSLTLTAGTALPIQTRVTGEYASYFTTARESNNIIMSLDAPLPEVVVDENSFILLDIEAYYPDAVSGFTAVVIELVKDPIIPPVFDQPYYVGEYSIADGLSFEPTIRLAQGFDNSVGIGLEGEDAEAFSLIPLPGENSFTLSVNTNELGDVVERNKLIFTVVATKPDSIPGQATIVIALIDMPETLVISFAQASYAGQITEGTLNVPPVLLTEGYDLPVQLNPIGEFASYFSLQRESNNVLVTLNGPLPPNIIDNNAFILLDIEASYPDAISGFTTVALEIVKQPIVHPVFEEAYYIGEYSTNSGLRFEPTIQLVQGFDNTVSFALEGDGAAAFTLVPTGPSSFTLSVDANALGNVVDIHKLVFSVVATKPDSLPGRAAIVIALRDMPEQLFISFAQASYVGQIVDGSINVPPAVLTEGNELAVQLSLNGEFASYFSTQRVSNNIIVTLNHPLPPTIIDNNAFILLDIEASYPDAISGFTTVALEIVKQPIVHPVFEEAYYIGEYSTDSGLRFEPTIQLVQGFDNTVSFALEGDGAAAFTLVPTGPSSFTLSVDANALGNVVDIHKLVFSVVATKPDSLPGRAAIVIALRDMPEQLFISFAQASYVGQIVNGSINVPPAVLTEGNELAVQLSLNGEFASYFSTQRVSNNIIVTLNHPLPPTIIDNNAFILLDIEASYPDAISGFTTVALEIVKQPIVHPVFEEAYYIGEYSTDSGLRFEPTIQLVQGFDNTVSFALEGDGAAAFSLVPIGQSSFSLSVDSNAIGNVVDINKLVFSVVATKPGTTSGRSAIIIALRDVPGPLHISFSQASYVGQIVEGSINLPPVTITEGYDLEVQLNPIGEFATYFTLTRQNNDVIVTLNAPLPSDVLEDRAFVLLDIEASYPGATSVITTIIFELVKEQVVRPEFDQTYYIGEFTTENGLVFEQTIRLVQGFDDSVLFDLEGDDSAAFSLQETGQNSFTLSVNANEIGDVINRNKLVFSVVATKPNSAPGRAAIVISLADQLQTALISFAQASYVGEIQDGSLNLPPLTITQGYDLAIQFNVRGDFASYFTLTRQSNDVIVIMTTALPPEAVNNNAFIVLDIEAFSPGALSGLTTVILELETLPDIVISPVFNQAYYSGEYTTDEGLRFEDTIQLIQGFDDTVTFDLEGDHSQWFDLDQSGNSARLVLRTSNPIPPAVIANNQKLVFVVTASRPGSITARSAIIITLGDEVSTDQILGFDSVSYLGTIEENTVNLSPIVLSEGFTTGVTFILHGDLQRYFRPDINGAIVTLELLEPVAPEDVPANRIIVLEIEASNPPALSAFATIVLGLDTVEDPATTPEPVFAETFYLGSYSSSDGLEFDTTISLVDGYDNSIVFALESDHSQWFDLDQSGNSARLVLRASNPIPPAVIANNQKLLFVVTASRPGSITARATIIITLGDEVSTDQILGFDSVSYLGNIEENTVNLSPIVLSEGFTTGVTFILHGDLQRYFRPNINGAIVTLELLEPIAPEDVPANRIIVLEIEASNPPALSAFATIVLGLDTVEDPPTTPEPVFAETFYLGSYSSSDGLEFDTTISLVDGYDNSIVFALESDHSQWFDLDQSGNSARLVLRASNPIPPAVIANNQKLLFVVTASRPGSITARATIIITLGDEVSTDQILGFDSVSYLGTIEENTVNLSPIVLSEGFTTGVTFILHGDLQRYFRPNINGAIVTLELLEPIAPEDVPANRIIVLEIEASNPPSLSAFATIVLGLDTVEDPPTTPEPVFAETFYLGSYSSSDGLEFDTTISLVDGYDNSIVFALESDHSQWFDLDQSGNSARLVLRASNPIPPAVIANNQKLLFVVTASRPGSITARATIIITLGDEVSTEQILGFDSVSYLGTIEENTVNLSPIVLSEGFTTGVTFILHGDLQRYFRPNINGAIVTLELLEPIAPEDVPANRIIVLEIEASNPPALSAFATIVLGLDTVEDPPTTPAPVFAETFYLGSYSSSDGLEFDTTISLVDGYDNSIVFALESDHSQWFDLDQSGNSARLVLRASNPIPPAVIANNQKLLFVVTASRPGSITARATIIITLGDEVSTEQILGFDSVSYLGTIEENTVNLSPIVLSEGFTTGVTFILHGDLQRYFRPNINGAIVTLELLEPIAPEDVPANRIIVLEIEASNPPALSAFATIVLGLDTVEDPPTTPAPVFAETFYLGSYSSSDGLEFDTTISLVDGYDNSIVFALESDHSQWFDLDQSGNFARLVLRASNPIPPAVIANNQKLLFVVTASRPGSITARATIIITLGDEVSTDQILGFDSVSYLGTIEENTVNLSPIVLSEGFTTGVTFILHGDLQRYFRPNINGAIVTLELLEPIAPEDVPANRIIVLEIEASNPPALSAFATIVLGLDTVEDPPTTPEPVFAETFYLGSYSSSDGLEFDTTISLVDGYDNSIVFALESDHSQWFDLDQSGNSARLVLRASNPIPPAVIANNQKLLFVVTASRPGSITARATIIITLGDEVSTDQILGFDSVSYLGTIEENTVNLSPIVLSEGFTTGVTFILHGDLQRYFRPNINGAIVTLELLEPIAPEDVPANRIIVLEIEASNPPALSAFATIVLGLDTVEDPPTTPEPVFAETFYLGSYSSSDGLEFDTTISLVDGYDNSIVFALESDHSQWFDLDQSGNSARLVLRASNPIPPAVIANNQKLLFVVTASRPGSITARATIIITLGDEVSTDQILGFDSVSYLGTIEENTVNLSPIVLSEGFTTGVTFILHGDLQRYFRPNINGAIVTLELLEPIAPEDVPANRIIVLEIEASNPPALSAFATIVLGLDTVEDPPTTPEPVFAETFYLGSYSSSDGLEFDTTISLVDGYDNSIVFALESDHSQWFDLDQSGNSARLVLRASNPIPPAVIANNQKLLFVVTASRPGSITARATIIITLGDEVSTDQILGFDSVSYLGTIEENTVNLSPIVLSEGFTTGVTFILHGDLQRYFRPNINGAIVTLELLEPIAPEDVPANRIIVLEIEASNPPALSAFATIVLGLDTVEDPPTTPEPVFAETFYLGSYSSSDGLEFDTTISLVDGYDNSIVFALESDHSQWFDLDQSGNSARLVLRASNPIPPAVIANNQKLLFVVTASRPGSITARATIIITLGDEVSTDQILGFDSVSYLGTIEENTVNLSPIVLSEGFTTGVTFILHGDLQRYFRPNINGAIVTLELLEPIAPEDVPANRIIVLEIEASNPPALSAFATIVLGLDTVEDPATTPEPVFAETFYLGSYSSSDGLEFDTTISLVDGYDNSIVFALESDHSQWFDLDQSGNSARLVLRASNPIPPAVIANNQKLLFVVTASRPGSITARATIIITLGDEVSTDQILGFDSVSYLGTIEKNTVNLSPIVLSEGFTTGVTFILHGDLQRYFRPNINGAIVTLELIEPIAPEAIPASRIIVLEIEASNPPALSAFATIVLGLDTNDDPPTSPKPVFAEAFYLGSYSMTGGLVFDTPISLAEGYDDSTIFSLEAEHSQWFDLDQSGNFAQVVLRYPIPPAVIANNQQLIFIVAAQRPGSTTARATVVITLIDESVPPVEPAASVTFESTSYVVRVEMGQTGLVGSVRATANNGETVTYSLRVDNEHLRARISINSVGELRISAPVNSGIYSFQAVATVSSSQVTGMATVHFSVEALTVCGVEPVVAPLIVLDRDEEEPLRHLVLLNSTEHDGCRYSLTSRWPVDQSWLYVDETGLHATAIDREDPSIAFMALSQVQVELTLTCEDDVTRTKRSVSEKLDWLGPYDYGTNTWLLGETILFNPRRSIVNLIVNDINDNRPIFEGKENEPIIVGYPVPEYEQTIRARSLAEVKATDADVGENAALVYWSSEAELAVSPRTGFVHVRNGQRLQNDQILTVSATDRNGQGLTGTIDLMVKLLDSRHIAVVTARNAFLEDESRILGNISNTIGYEVRALRSVVISDAEQVQTSRIKRQIEDTEASLEIYVYGLVQREPIAVDILITDIEDSVVAAVNIANIQSLEDHLESTMARDSTNNTGLLAATITLSILLFLLILAVLIWFFIIRRRKMEQNYDQFSDGSSLVSQKDLSSQLPKPLDASAFAKPRLNIEELKKSERRLQSMLNAPVEEAPIEPTTSTVNATMKSPSPPSKQDPLPTIVIQDKLKDAAEESDDDEFGEIKKSRRKSVVTFNENVEKIIHVDETPDATESNFEVYKL